MRAAGWNSRSQIEKADWPVRVFVADQALVSAILCSLAKVQPRATDGDPIGLRAALTKDLASLGRLQLLLLAETKWHLRSVSKHKPPLAGINKEPNDAERQDCIGDR
jgi:hypothetical protein